MLAVGSLRSGRAQIWRKTRYKHSPAEPHPSTTADPSATFAPDADWRSHLPVILDQRVYLLLDVIAAAHYLALNDLLLEAAIQLSPCFASYAIRVVGAHVMVLMTLKCVSCFVIFRLNLQPTIDYCVLVST
jgi:hypothetical protein